MQRRALGVLFLVLAAGFGGIAYAAATADQWVIVAASGALGLWMAGLSARGFRA